MLLKKVHSQRPNRTETCFFISRNRYDHTLPRYKSRKSFRTMFAHNCTTPDHQQFTQSTNQKKEKEIEHTSREYRVRWKTLMALWTSWNLKCFPHGASSTQAVFLWCLGTLPNMVTKNISQRRYSHQLTRHCRCFLCVCMGLGVCV